MQTVTLLYNYFSPAYKAGGPIQSLVNLVNVLNKDLAISVICSNKDHDSTALDVVPNKWTEAHGARVFYNSNGYSMIKKIITGDSVIFINGMYSPQYNFFPALKFPGRKIISARGMLHPEGLRQKWFKKAIYLWLWKGLRIHKRCEFHATDEREKQFIQQIFGQKTRVWVIQNLPRQLAYFPVPAKSAGELKIVTVALISPMKNHLAILQALRKCRFKVTYSIYGAVKDSQYWQLCKRMINQLPPNIKVLYEGDVAPSCLDAVLSEHHVYIQPSLSENFGHSLYEALSKGRPVITSERTPWNKLRDAKAGMNLASSDVTGLAEAIDHFAEMSHRELSEWSAAARKYAENAVDIEQIRRQYLEMFSR